MAKGNVNRDEQHNYGLEVNNANRAICIIGNGTTRNIVTSAATVPSGVFTHIACTWNGTALAVYINGVLDSSFSRRSLLPPTHRHSLSDSSEVSDFANATIDEVKIYKRALSVTEIAADMNASTQP